MSTNEISFINNLTGLLHQDYRGVNIAVYTLASAGLAASIYKIRPISKFSKAGKVPDHFIKNHEPLKGLYAGVQHSPLRLLVNHKAPIYLPLWHSSKPPLPVKLWGVNIVSGNAVNWLECVAQGQQVTLKPIQKEEDALVCTVALHLKKSKSKSIETLDIGKSLVQLGFAKASVPQNIKKNTLESQIAPAILTAEAHAKKYRNGVWSEHLPPVPLYVLYWRRSSQYMFEILVMSLRKSLEILGIVSKSALVGVKNITLRTFKSNPKRVQQAT